MSSAPQSLVSLSHTSSSSRPRLRFLLILLFSALLGFATFTHGAAETTTGSTIQPIITFPQTTTQQECIPAPQYLIDVATCKQMCSGSYQNDERTICWAGCDWYNDGGDEYCKCACSQGVPRSDLQNPCVTGCGFADDTSKVLLCPANEFAQVENDGSQSCTPVTACSTATEYQVVAPTASSDRQCAVLSTCSPSQYEVTAATATSDRECQDVSVCDRRTEFEQQPPTTTSDRECATITICEAATQYETKAPTSTSDRECAPVTICTRGTEFEVTPPTATTDRVCQLITQCDPQSEYQTVSPTFNSDRECAALTTCSVDTEYESTPPTATTDRTCSNLTVCGASQFEAQAATATSDRTCQDITICLRATQYEQAPPTTTSDRECQDVSVCDRRTEFEQHAPTATSDRECATITTCNARTEYETKAPTSTTDRECTTLTPCVRGEEYQSVGPTATSDRECTPITHCHVLGKYQTIPATFSTDAVCANLSRCDATTQYELGAPTATSDRVCDDLASCNIDQYETAAPTATSDRECANLTVCDPVTQFQATAPTATSDRLCANLTSSSTQSPTAAAAIASVQIPEASNLGLAVSVLGALVCCFGLVRTVRTPVWPLFLSLALCHVYFGVESVALSDDISFSLVADRCLALGAFKLALSLSCLCWLGACVLQSSTDINPFTLRPLGLFAIVCAIPITTAVALVAAAPSSFGASTGWCDLHQPLARGLAGILASCTLGFSPLIYASIRRIRHRRQFFMGDIVDDLFGNESRIQRPLLAAAILLVVANRVSLNLPVHLSVDDDIPEHMPVVNVMCAVALTAVSLVFLCTRLGRSDNNGSNKGGLAGYASPNNSGDPSKFVHLNTMPADDVPRSFVSRISKRGAFSPSTPAHLPGSISRSMLTSFRYLPRYENDSSSDDVSGMSISDKVHEDVSGIHEDTSSSSILRGLTSLDISDGGESIDLFPVAIDRQEVENADVESIEDNVVVV